jgi:prevent-host-death family protein
MQSFSAHDAKAHFGKLLDTARREPVTIEIHGRAVAVVISKEDFDDLEARNQVACVQKSRKASTPTMRAMWWKSLIVSLNSSLTES